MRLIEGHDYLLLVNPEDNEDPNLYGFQGTVWTYIGTCTSDIVHSYRFKYMSSSLHCNESDLLQLLDMDETKLLRILYR